MPRRLSWRSSVVAKAASGHISACRPPMGPSRGSPAQPTGAVADAVARAPVTEEGVRGVVAVGEQAVKEDAAKEFVRALIQALCAGRKCARAREADEVAWPLRVPRPIVRPERPATPSRPTLMRP